MGRPQKLPPNVRRCHGKFRAVAMIDGRRVYGPLRLAYDHPSIQMAVLVIDSPGGSPNGIVQLAQRMRRYGVIAHVAGLAAGSAYWLASNLLTTQADPLAQVGCLHVKENAVWLHPDRGIGHDTKLVRNHCASELQQARGVGPGLAERLLAGELFVAEEAKAHNLIDRVATLDRARLQACNGAAMFRAAAQNPPRKTKPIILHGGRAFRFWDE